MNYVHFIVNLSGVMFGIYNKLHKLRKKLVGMLQYLFEVTRFGGRSIHMSNNTQYLSIIDIVAKQK